MNPGWERRDCRQADAAEQGELIRRNTELTETTKALSERIRTLTEEVRDRMIPQA